jgi:hypothetical protein
MKNILLEFHSGYASQIMIIFIWLKYGVYSLLTQYLSTNHLVYEPIHQIRYIIALVKILWTSSEAKWQINSKARYIQKFLFSPSTSVNNTFTPITDDDEGSLDRNTSD